LAQSNKSRAGAKATKKRKPLLWVDHRYAPEPIDGLEGAGMVIQRVRMATDERAR
jgi:hypothetical protein